tara:strand:+ start:109 stop:333 length:225 start_codon:yes stop_codon:yes gene_type:complete
MDPTLKQHILFGLETFMFNTMSSPNKCVDWVCNQWNLNATDEVIDLVAEAHFAMFADNDGRGQDSAFMDDMFGG